MRNLVGIDEAGRGPLAGPLAIGIFKISDAKVLRKIIKNGPSKLTDSKKMTKINRDKWFTYLQALSMEKVVSFCVVLISAKEIDRRGLGSVLKIGVARALSRASADFSDHIFLDGSLHAPSDFKNQKTIIKGDEKVPVISLASIVAKVSRDNLMDKISKKYPKYNFVSHKGYGTKEHCEKIKRFGVIEGLHRRSFLKYFD